MKYIFIILFIPSIFAELIHIQESKVLFFDYYNNNNKPISISINNNFYRESSTLPYSYGNFAVKVNPGTYNIPDQNNTKYNLYKYDADYIKYSQTFLKDIKISEYSNWIVIDNINYFEHQDHILYIASTINLVKFNKFNYNIRLTINNMPLVMERKNTSTFTYFSSQKYPEGFYNIKLEIQNLDHNIICSCPSIGNGFVFGRHLTVWINKMNTNIINIPITYRVENNIDDIYPVVFYENESYIKEYSLEIIK